MSQNRKAPPDPDAVAFHAALSELVRAYQFRDRRRICYHDISVTQCYALESVILLGSPTLGELAAELYIDKSTTSRVVDALERKGYLRRNSGLEDARVVHLEATASGRRLHRTIERELIDEEARLLGGHRPHDSQGDDRGDPAARAGGDESLRDAVGVGCRLIMALGLTRWLSVTTKRRGARMEVTVRSAVLADRECVRTLLESSGLHSDGLDALLETAFVVAGADARTVIGCGALEVLGRHGLVRGVAVEPGSRGRGVASAIVRVLLERAHDAGLDAVYLLTDTAAGFFARRGFAIVDRDTAPQAIRATRQFMELCPESATFMRLRLYTPHEQKSEAVGQR